eukprot:TRINITY_DN111258_c0_g1_i1.p1 TRINITY_DN111258_c0_g1~~TRINITY_DN111258_c0_g1_i1.p1  ORF type:complete len:697 (+),score=162.35 TRINITY_DN111258_c0_g1_i1:65-2092(+)
MVIAWAGTLKLAAPVAILAFVLGTLCGSRLQKSSGVREEAVAATGVAPATTFAAARSVERPHSHAHPKTLLPAVPVPRWHAWRRDDKPPTPAGGGASGPSEGSSPMAFLHLDKTTLDGHETTITVSWSNVSFGSENDWIGMWPITESFHEKDVFSTPIKYKYVMGDTRRCYTLSHNEAACKALPICKWAEVKCIAGSPQPTGNVTFEVWNKRADVVFRYISGNMQYPELIAESERVLVVSKGIPQGGHLALGDDATSMKFYWQAGADGSKPGVKYGSSCGDLKDFAEGSVDPLRQFTAADMCDKRVAPASRQGWFDPGTLYQATLTGLEPGQTYCYVYGDDHHGWSKPDSFKASPLPGRRYPTTVATFGDMGQVETDSAWHHSWDFENRGEIPSANTTSALEKDTASELVLHIGDISYAVGYISEWDNFFRQIMPVARRKPWMTAIGNHEMVFSNSYYAGADSGGECGVPYNAYFPFASLDEKTGRKLFDRRPWYSFKYGPATFVVMSTEHNFTIGGEQNDWLEATLAAVDRSVTPWVVFTGHRPMYTVADFVEDTNVATEMQKNIEPMLIKHNVDIALWGHFHAYVRFTKLAKGQATKTGVQHLIIGMGGYDHSKPSPSDLVVTANDQSWGYLRMTFQSDKEAQLEFIDGATTKAVETFTVEGNAGRMEADLTV